MIALDSNPAVSVRLVIPCTGAWLADVDLDLPSTTPMPTGRVTVSAGGESLSGSVDARASGRFGEKARVRVIAGAGGWDRVVAARHFQNDAGLLSTAVLSATAAELGESVVDPTPVLLGNHYVRAAGAASKVFGGRDWYLDASGLTHVASRPPAVAPIDVDVLSWDPSLRMAELATDELVWPGTILNDTRFASATVRDVELTFGNGRGRALAWCGTVGASRLSASLASMASHAVGASHLRLYRYRIVAQNADGRLLLQTTTPGGTVPDALPIDVWPGMAGLSAEAAPGTEVLLGFVQGDPAQPVVLAFQSESPVRLTLDAKQVIELGAGAQSPAARGDELTRCLDDLRAALRQWTPVAQDGGAALKTALTNWLAASYDLSATLVRVR